MKLKLIGLLTVLLTSQAVSANSFKEVSCWDGTFGYNTFSVVKNSGKVFLGLSGHQLGPIEFGDTWDDHLDIPEWGRQDTVIFTVADLNKDCTESENSLDCVVSRPSQKVFVKKNIRDLNSSKEVITPVNGKALQFSINKKNDNYQVDVDFETFFVNVTLSKNISGFGGCKDRGQQQFSSISKAPQRLIDFVLNN